MNSLLKMIMFITLDVATFPFACVNQKPCYLDGTWARFFYGDEYTYEEKAIIIESKDNQTIELDERVFQVDDQGNEILYYYLYDMSLSEEEQNTEKVDFPYIVNENTPTSTWHFYGKYFYSTVVLFKAFINVENNG